MARKVEQIYRKLSEVEHVLKRPGRYLGATAVAPQHAYTIVDGDVVWREVNYSPAFLKLFDEIISNSADFSKRDEGKHLDKIEVEIDRGAGRISVHDNGGIPVLKHEEYDQYIPDMIFGELRSGSNFDDDEDSVSTGQNGEGSTLTNIFSKEFTVDTADGENRFVCTYHDNMSHKDVPAVSKCRKSYTKISYIPDYDRLGITLDDDHYAMIVRRTYEIAATNTHLKVYLNGSLIKFKSFKDFAALFSTERIDFGTDRFQVSVFHSRDGFQQVGFINSTNVYQGGTHIDYVMNQLVSGIRDHVKKKTKQDVKPSDIKNHFFLMTNATLNNPRYNSQTKEKLETLPKDYGTTLEIDQKTIQRLIKSDIVAEIVEWAENKKQLEDLAALRKKNKDLDKSTSLRDIAKYEPATSKNRGNCMLFISEGDSAARPLQSARNPEIHGIFPLKGKPMNVREKKLADLIANEELNALMRIIGLQFGVNPLLSELRYQKLIIATDQDLDGYHLCALVVNMFQQLWPALVKKGFLVKLETPIVRAVQGKKEFDFMSLKDFEDWKEKQTKPFQSQYLKGLGSNDTKYLKQYMFDEKYMLPVTWEDAEDARALDIAFDKKLADERKTYIYGKDYAN
jgi:DNA gyrase/topoisomerase IV subunit B